MYSLTSLSRHIPKYGLVTAVKKSIIDDCFCVATQRIHWTLNYDTQRLYVSADCAVQSNASVNQWLLLHQRAGETRAHTDVMSLTAILRFSHTSDEWMSHSRRSR